MLTASRVATAFAVAVLFATRLPAASVDINPVRIDFADAERPAELKLTNTGEQDMSVQIDSLRWEQGAEASDELIATDRLLVVPPIVTIPAGGQQIIRIGYVGTPDPEREQSFRLLITELMPETDSDRSTGLALRMRFSIPAFVPPQDVPARPDVILSGVETIDDRLLLTVENQGNAHARLGTVQVRGDRGWEDLPGSHQLRYLLSGTVATIEVPPGIDRPRAVRFISVDGRDWEYAVDLRN